MITKGEEKVQQRQKKVIQTEKTGVKISVKKKKKVFRKKKKQTQLQLAVRV